MAQDSIVANKNPARKKRKVSKHVLKAREDQELAQDLEQAKNPATPVIEHPLTPKPSTNKRKQKKNRHVKDPSEAATYLNGWKEKKSGKECSWKFNKNTQSWLIRHMYEVDKVAKASFSILLEYLDGLEGKTTRSRIRSEASRRALRYKEWSKKNDDDESVEAADAKKEEEAAGKKSANADTTTSVEEQMEEEARWQKLGDHDRRKEYKRTRKILEIIKD